MEFVTLNNGIKMPVLGYGVYQVDPVETVRCVLDAIEVGYRSIDTAQAYGNEEGVGNAIVKCGVPREELFLTTKVWITNAGYENAKRSIEESLNKLQSEYIDLLLIHQPFNDYYGTYRAMEEAYRAGKVRAIGVSNFYPDRFVDLANFCEVVPAVNQVEFHPLFNQKELLSYCKSEGIAVQAYAPLARGAYLHSQLLLEIGSRYQKTTAQIGLRWLVQQGVSAIPKSTHKDRILENADIFDFSLTEEEMNEA